MSVLGPGLGGALVDLCSEALAGRLDPVAGREEELSRVICVLARRTKRNPVLLGEPGVGKSAIAEGLAGALAEGRVPPALRGRRLLSLNLGALLAGTSCRGDFEARMQDLLTRLAADAGCSILFIDELHLLLRAGRSEGGVDAANYLKPLLARGGLSCLGASTPVEWTQVCGEDPALARRFLAVPVLEPDRAAALCMLRTLRAALERHHGVRISEGALESSLEPVPGLGGRLPDRAVDRLDEACARLRMRLEERTVDTVANSELEAARRRFDLQAYARLKAFVRPTLPSASGVPVLEAEHLTWH